MRQHRLPPSPLPENWQHFSASKKHRLSVLAAGLCGSCYKNPFVAGKTKCQPCLDKQKGEHKLLLESSVCTTCKEPWNGPQNKCDPCRKEISIQGHLARRKNAKRKSCLSCGAPRDCEGRICAKCLNDSNDRRRAIRERRKIDGCCADCDRKSVGNSGFCRYHFFYFYAAKLGDVTKADDLEQMWEHQAGKCEICPHRMILAVDINLCHYKDRDRYPELANDLTNLFWGHAYCNRSQSNKTLPEYFQHCIEVVETARLRGHLDSSGLVQESVWPLPTSHLTVSS